MKLPRTPWALITLEADEGSHDFKFNCLEWYELYSKIPSLKAYILPCGGGTRL